MLEHNEVVLVSSDDLKCAFYIFRLPKTWAPYLCFSEEMTRAELHGPGCERADERVLLALIVVPWVGTQPQESSSTCMDILRAWLGCPDHSKFDETGLCARLLKP